MRTEDFDTSKQYQATLVSSERITEDDAPAEVKELIFDIKNTDFHYELGHT